MKDESWQHELAVTVDITARLSDLFFKMRGRRKLITELYDDIKCFINSMGLWRAQPARLYARFHFTACKELKEATSNDSELSFVK